MMDNVKEIRPDAHVGQVSRQQPASARQPADSVREKEGGNAADSSRDILQVDQRRREDVRLEENAKLLLKELPDVRLDRIEEARRRLQEGFYDQEDVLRQTADRILQDQRPSSTAEVKQTSAPTPRTTELSKVDQARNRLNAGFYDQPEILEETARRILKRNS